MNISHVCNLYEIRLINQVCIPILRFYWRFPIIYMFLFIVSSIKYVKTAKMSRKIYFPVRSKFNKSLVMFEDIFWNIWSFRNSFYSMEFWICLDLWAYVSFVGFPSFIPHLIHDLSLYVHLTFYSIYLNHQSLGFPTTGFPIGLTM